jgi:hypothetical protein
MIVPVLEQIQELSRALEDRTGGSESLFEKDVAIKRVFDRANLSHLPEGQVAREPPG